MGDASVVYYAAPHTDDFIPNTPAAWISVHGSDPPPSIARSSSGQVVLDQDGMSMKQFGKPEQSTPLGTVNEDQEAPADTDFAKSTESLSEEEVDESLSDLE